MTLWTRDTSRLEMRAACLNFYVDFEISKFQTLRPSYRSGASRVTARYSTARRRVASRRASFTKQGFDVERYARLIYITSVQNARGCVYQTVIGPLCLGETTPTIHSPVGHVLRRAHASAFRQLRKLPILITNVISCRCSTFIKSIA